MISGSFSSFGHATVKARDPNENKVTYAPVSSTKSPYSTIEPYTAHSTVSVNTKTYPKDAKPTSTINFHHKIKDDFSVNLVPPSQAPFKYLHNYTSTDKKKQYASSNDFIPSPVDPLSKLQNNGDIIKIQPEKTNAYSTYNINIGGSRKPEISSFFDTTPPPVSTVDPFEPQSTNAVPNNLLVQVPPPYTNINTFNKDHVVKNQNAPNKEVKFHQSFTSVTHGKYGSFDEVKYYPPRGHEYFEKVPKNPQNQKTKEKIPHKTTYEVTEHWGSSGEANTQPPLNSWNAPSQSYKNFNSYVPKPQYNTIAENGKRVIPPPFYPTPMSSSAPEITSPGDISTIYPSAADNSANSFFSQLENSLSTLAQIDGEIGDEVHDLATPTSNTVNVSSANEYKYPSTEFYEDIPITTTNPPPNTRRKPSKYRNPTETTTESATESDLKDFTTRFETYKEQVSAADQDVDLATIPPSKHFKRPSTTLTTTTSSIHWDEESRKRIKNRRRKPTKHLPTDFNTADSITTTEATRVNRFKTTSGSDQDNSYRSRNKFRYNKNRYNKPESDNNGQSVITTTPRQKWNTRTKATTPLSLDLDDFGDTTTHQIEKLPDLNNKQSSIMKIAKDSHKPASINANPTYDNLNEFPDYSHKQDEKDTPTSDIAISSIEYNYEQQPSHTDTVEYKPDDTKSSLSSVADVISSPTSPGLSEENIAANSISQTTRSEQLFTNLKSGSRGSTKADGAKSDSEISATANLDVSSTTPTPVGAKLNKIKSKPNKYDSNRPRFSVKDYRNRLNQMTTSTSTEKPNQSSEPGPKLKFPSRSRFPILKDHLDVKASAPDTNSTTESPRKKFAPKDPRHRDDVEEKVEEKVKIQTKSKAENTPIIKPINSLRGGLRRDPNRNKVAVVNETTVEPLPQEEKPIEVSSKRPILSGLRKRISQKNHTSEVVPAETKISEVSDIISEASVNNITVEVKPEVAEEKQSSETAIMKIAKDDKRRQDDNVEDFLDPSQRVSDLTLASSKEYNTPGLFKSVSPNSRRVPSYFTIATDDPILPIEAFFPQLNQKKEA